MKSPQVNYRESTLSPVLTARFSHLWLLLGWVAYFILYILTERLIPVENCAVMHSALDDLIPFCEWFVIPYVGWYLVIFGSLLYFALYNVESFKKLQWYFIICQATAMVIYILFPNMQDLRPATFPRDNLLTDLVGILYTADTPTNVCPSMHVAYSLAMISVWLKEKNVSKLMKGGLTVFLILVCLSTVFIKQHSVLDGYAAILLCLVIEVILYGKSYWLPKLVQKK